MDAPEGAGALVRNRALKMFGFGSISKIKIKANWSLAQKEKHGANLFLCCYK